MRQPEFSVTFLFEAFRARLRVPAERADACQFAHSLWPSVASFGRDAICVRKPRRGCVMRKLHSGLVCAFRRSRASARSCGARRRVSVCTFIMAVCRVLRTRCDLRSQTAQRVRNAQTAQWSCLRLSAQQGARASRGRGAVCSLCTLIGCCGLRTQTATHSPQASAKNPSPGAQTAQRIRASRGCACWL